MERYGIYLTVLFVFVIRLLFLKVSNKNEKAILENGGSEYGVKNSKMITILHIIFYVGSLAEAFVRKIRFDEISVIGIIALICHSQYVSIVVMPLYAIVLYIRIKQENEVIRDIIKPNGSY